MPTAGNRDQDSINFYEINCPENINEEEEVQLGLGDLLEDHRVHFMMEKLSNNFSSTSGEGSGKSRK